MKNFIKDPESYFLLGLLGIIIAIPSEKLCKVTAKINIMDFLILVCGPSG